MTPHFAMYFVSYCIIFIFVILRVIGHAIKKEEDKRKAEGKSSEIPKS